MTVHSTRICHKPHTTALKTGKSSFSKNLYTRFDNNPR
jgi:hypothetical protein